MGNGLDSIVICNNFTEWKWFRNCKVLSVFMWLLLSANTTVKVYEKERIPRGSLVTNNVEIAYDCGLTVQNVRTALANLEKTGYITRERRNHYQVINIMDYETYATEPD